MIHSLMSKTLINILFLGLLIALSELPDFDEFKWKGLEEGSIRVEYYDLGDITWCKSSTIANYSIQEISQFLEDKANYPNIFDRITETILYTDDIVHIKLDMPFPFSGRDYIVRYTEVSNDISKEYRWLHYDDFNIPVEKGYVRLPRAAGKWKLTEVGNRRTKIEYIWNGELLGDFPSWAMSRAWKEQGVEVLSWLIEYIEHSESIRVAPDSGDSK